MAGVNKVVLLHREKSVPKTLFGIKKRREVTKKEINMAENQPPKSKRDQFGERLKAKHPDGEYADDEALFGQIDEDYANYDAELGQYREREGKLTALLGKDPRSAQFISDMAKGEDPWIAVVKRLGVDGITDLMNDPSKQEAYAEANREYVERLAKEKGLEEEYQNNFDASMQMLEQMQQERGLSDETIDAAMDLVLTMANEAVVGKFSRETVEMALKAVTHDAEVENARSEGEVAGRNAKIDETLRKHQDGDGMPAGNGGTGVPPKKKGRKTFFDLVDAAK